MKIIPIGAAKEIAEKYDYDQIIVWAYDRKTGTQSVVTFGKSIEDCDQVAQGGNHIKEHLLNWPKSECCAEPDRVKKLKDEIKRVKRELSELERS